MLANNKLFETIVSINDEEHGEIISIKLQFISKPVLTANGNIDYKNITHNYTIPGYNNEKDSDIIKISLPIFLKLYLIQLEIKNAMY